MEGGSWSVKIPSSMSGMRNMWSKDDPVTILNGQTIVEAGRLPDNPRVNEYLKKKISEGKLIVQNRDPSNPNNSTPPDINNLPSMFVTDYDLALNNGIQPQIYLVITKDDGSTYYFRIDRREDGKYYLDSGQQTPQLQQQLPPQPPPQLQQQPPIQLQQQPTIQPTIQPPIQPPLQQQQGQYNPQQPYASTPPMYTPPSPVSSGTGTVTF